MANPLFMQAIMSLIQFGEYISWKLPNKCHLILSSNPDNGKYNVTEIDAAQKSRMINFEVNFDVKIWSKWADKVGLRSEFINFALLTPEMFERNANINARSYTLFANACKGLQRLDTEDALEKIALISKGCFNDDWVSGMFVQFINNKLDKLIDAESMLKDDWKTVKNKMIDNIYRDNKYNASIASTLTIRFCNYVEQYFSLSSDKKKTETVIDRIIDFCTSDKDIFTEDLIYKLVRDLNGKYPQRCQKFMKYPQIRDKMF